MPVGVGDVSGLAGVPRVAAPELGVEAGDVPVALQGEGVLHRDLGRPRVAVVMPGIEHVARVLVDRDRLKNGP